MHSPRNLLASLAPEARDAFVAGLTDAEAAALFYDWRAWARPSQLPPEGDWDGWLILAGRGYGKTRTGAETVCAEAIEGRSKRIGLVAETSADGRDVLVNGESGILACSPPWFRPVFARSDGRPKLTWPNGAIATLYDARAPDQLRGPQHDFVWFDELAKFRYAQDVFDQAMFGLRLGARPRWLATTTPFARRVAEKQYPGTSAGGRNGEGDAFRHAYWNAAMTKAIGPDRAQAFAHAVEVQGGNPVGERQMDLYNNREGRALATQPGPLADTIKKAITDERLRTRPF